MARAQSSTVSSGDMESTLCGPGLILQTEHFHLTHPSQCPIYNRPHPITIHLCPPLIPH